MRPQKELQDWLNKTVISVDEVRDVDNWLNTCGEYDSKFNFVWNKNGATLQDVIDFVNSESPQTDHSQIVAQYEKVRKEMNKLEKLINRMR